MITLIKRKLRALLDKKMAEIGDEKKMRELLDKKNS